MMIAQHWIAEFNQHESIILAFSGGLDSTVLLHLLSHHENLSNKIKAIHINHGLHPDANRWETHCVTFCRHYDMPCFIEKVFIQGSGNLEEKARNARYAVLKKWTNKTSCLLTAHHQDDQAETVLLNLMRGSGIAGLCAMPSSKLFGEGVLYRPLLQTSRQALMDYAIRNHLIWIDDPANENEHFSRNFIRHNVLPLLKKRWNASNRLANVAELAQEAQSNLDDLAVIDYPSTINDSNTLTLTPILHLAEPRIKNVIRFWFKQRQLRPLNRVTWQCLYHELIHAAPDANPSIAWDNHIIRRYQKTLYLIKKSNIPNDNPASTKGERGIIWHDFPKPIRIQNVGIVYAEESEQGVRILPSQLIDIRFRKGGEIFYWHGQHQSLKKLMQIWQIPPWERSLVPLLYVEDKLAGVIGYGISEEFLGHEIENTYTFYIKSVQRQKQSINISLTVPRCQDNP